MAGQTGFESHGKCYLKPVYPVEESSFEMKKTYIIAIAIVVVFITVVGYIFVIPKGDFEWGVEIGDSFHYKVRAWGDNDSGYLAGIPFDDLMNLNDSIIESNITTLPPVDWITGANAFLSNVVQEIKVNCRLINGTSLPSLVNDIISKMVSVCLLPIGDWSVLDAFYADEIVVPEHGQEYYASKLLDGRFIFEWIAYGDFDSQEDWIGEITLENGIPYNVIWHYNHCMADVYIELNLVES